LPYILKQSEIATKTGYPVLQALIFHHPEDRVCWHIDDEYYFGNEFLVAPVMNSDNRRDIYLPKGTWINFFTGERYEGERWLYGYDVPLDLMPVFVHPGAEIAIYPDAVECTDEMDMTKTVTLKIDKNFKGYKI
jgi:alpha-D-xyloside xylohydrolase